MTTYRVEYLPEVNEYAVMARSNRVDRFIDRFPDEESAEMEVAELRDRARQRRLAELAPTMLRTLKMASGLIVLLNSEEGSAPNIVLGEIRRVIALVERS